MSKRIVVVMIDAPGDITAEWAADAVRQKCKDMNRWHSDENVRMKVIADTEVVDPEPVPPAWVNDG